MWPVWATPADAAALAALHATGEPGWSAAAIASLQGSPGCFALWWPGRAFILVRSVLDEAEILALATAPGHRRLGLARALLSAAAAACVARGVKALHLEVAEDNGPARSLYSTEGFVRVGRRPCYYAGGTAALLLRLNLCAAEADPAPG